MNFWWTGNSGLEVLCTIALAKVVGTSRQLVPVSTPLQQVLVPLWKRLFAAEAVIAPHRPTNLTGKIPHRSSLALTQQRLKVYTSIKNSFLAWKLHIDFSFCQLSIIPICRDCNEEHKLGWSSYTSSVALHFPRSNPPSSLPQFEVFSQNVTDNQGSLTINVLLCLDIALIFWKLFISESALFHICQHRLNLAPVSLRSFLEGAIILPPILNWWIVQNYSLYSMRDFGWSYLANLTPPGGELKNMQRITLSFYCRTRDNKHNRPPELPKSHCSFLELGLRGTSATSADDLYISQIQRRASICTAKYWLH